MNLIGKKLLFLTSHPDDESFLAAGTINKNRKAKGKSFLICATLGERGISHLKKPIVSSKLKRLRKSELVAVCRLLGVARLHTFNFPDGNLKKYKTELFEESLPIAKKIKPDVIVSFGPDGVTGHLDHIATGEVAARIAKKLHTPLAFFALPTHIAHHLAPWMLSRRKTGYYTKHLALSKPNVRIATDPAIKKKALLCHASQIDENDPYTGLPRGAADDMLSTEYFCC